jgi:glyoxylase-like metal-dependent hydrolase (beta-lactamase superfamily II)
VRNYLTYLLGLAFALFSPFSVLAQQIEKPNAGPDTPASPEMARLWNAFGGDWDNTEAMERSEFFPNGGARTGTSRWWLAIGGTIVIDEGHSDGSAGPLWLSDHRTIVFADALTAPRGKLLVWTTPWHEERVLPALRKLLAFPLERVIVSHGEPVHTAAEFELALQRPPWTGSI